DIEGIDVEHGLANNGGADTFIFSLGLFVDTMEDNLSLIQNALKEDDIKLFTIKVHALKSAGRIIGADHFSEMARGLEDAGKRGDIDYISNHTKELIDEYRELTSKLARVNEAFKTVDDRPIIAREELKDAYRAIAELAPQMDYDGIEVVLTQISEYRLEEKDDELFRELEMALKTFNWDRIEELLQENI
nr:Hpt domain-containing protein [Pseudobutyrivibrio sp.]